jgi:hypothetical protein
LQGARKDVSLGPQAQSSRRGPIMKWKEVENSKEHILSLNSSSQRQKQPNLGYIEV